jgi:N-acetylglucosamine kinase
MATSTALFIGVDGGGTKTTCVVVAADGSVIGTGVAAASNYHNVGIDAAVTAVDACMRAALKDADADVFDVASGAYCK